jgi:hypothetical protein
MENTIHKLIVDAIAARHKMIINFRTKKNPPFQRVDAARSIRELIVGHIDGLAVDLALTRFEGPAQI